MYGSGGWISYTIDELIEEVTEYADRGFKAVKIKVGSSKIITDLERLTKVRETVGDKVDIMMDVNQGMDLPSAIKLSNGAKDLNIHWFEEPDILPLLCTIPNGIGAESFDWINPLIDNPMVVKDGYAQPHDLPGWGFNFIDDRLEEIK